MKYRKRIYYTEADKALMWDRWQKGESLGSIARHFGRSHSSIQGILSRTGGIRPPARRRSSRSLSLSEREEISRGLAAGRSLRSIALRLGRAPSTISRELNRNGGLDSYRAHAAEQAAWDRSRRPKRCKLALNRPLAMTVAGLLRQRWSPWQIAGRLKRLYPHDEDRRVSHETIYKTLFIQARGALKKELVTHLRRHRTMRRSRHHTQKTPDHGQITDAVSIRERPAEAEDRAVPGHWEGDLICGSNNSQIATLVERHSRYCMLVRTDSKDTKTVVNALIKQAHKLPRELYKSLTWDRGKELADHKRFTLATDV
jgi:IS30 family transposase